MQNRRLEPTALAQTRQNPRVDGYGSGFGPTRRCVSDFWTVLEPKRTVFPVSTRTAGGLPGPIADTIDRLLVTVIPSHILDSVLYPLPESLIISHASHELRDAIPVAKPLETQSSVFFLQHVVIVRPHTLHFDPTLDIFVHFTHRERVVGIVLLARLKATLSVAFPWLRDVSAQQSAGSGVCVRPWPRRWLWLSLRVCYIFNLFEVGKRVQLFN